MGGACRQSGGGATAPSANVAQPTIVSLVPAATDLLVAMNATDHLVGVSNYETDRQVEKLPRVGDYLTTDWERITALHPQIILTQYAEGRTPAGFTEHLTAIGARQENLRLNRLDEIFATLTHLGDIANEPAKAASAADRLHHQLDGVRQRVAGLTPTRALMVIDETGRSAAGSDTYLDDLLEIAGGKNVIDRSYPSWPMLDSEMLVSLRPAAIIQLLPGSSKQVQEQAMQNWNALPQLPAVRDGRIIQLTGDDALEPGSHVGELAAQFADALHPQTVAAP